MGMESNRDPMRRRRVGQSDPSQRVQVSIRLSYEAGRILNALRQPGLLDPDGCSKGDVIERAIREMAVRRGLTLSDVARIKRREGAVVLSEEAAHVSVGADQ